VSALRVAFAGTPDFSVPALEALVASGHSVVGVLTQPDRPKGRGRQITASPVKAAALAHGIPVSQPQSLKSEADRAELAAWRPDVLVVVAYGLILPRAALALPRLGCINIHASLLPRWRGAAPIQRAILAGDAHTGVTIMIMDVGLDTGPMLLQERVVIEANDTGGSLHDPRLLEQQRQGIAAVKRQGLDRFLFDDIAYRGIGSLKLLGSSLNGYSFGNLAHFQRNVNRERRSHLQPIISSLESLETLFLNRNRIGADRQRRKDIQS